MQAQKPSSARGGKSSPKGSVKADITETVSAVQALPEEHREQAIRLAAYALYEVRGCVYGHALQDWLEAEAQVERAFATLPSGAEPGQTGH